MEEAAGLPRRNGRLATQGDREGEGGLRDVGDRGAGGGRGAGGRGAIRARSSDTVSSLTYSGVSH